MTDPRRAREVAFAAAAAAFVAFAAWGSLFPFEFVHTPSAYAWELFWAPWQRGPASWSISDLVSNVMLFVPIGMCLTAALDARVPSPRPAGALGVVAFAVALSIAVEAGQAYVPYRTPSAVDVLAETLGAALGALAWRLRGAAADARISAAIAAAIEAPVRRRVLLAYCLLFAVAWLLPLDFTLRPGEIADKYVHKRLLLPLTPSPDAASGLELALAFIAAIPIGVAAVVCGPAPGGRRRLRAALAAALPALCLLEAAQVTVFSRTTDTTAFLALVAATVAGAASAR
jgi:VanZ family protein